MMDDTIFVFILVGVIVGLIGLGLCIGGIIKVLI